MTSVLVRELAAVSNVLVGLPWASKTGSRLPVVGPVPSRGAHGSSAPLLADTAASRLRLTEPMALKFPPRYTVEFVAAMARTELETLGRKSATSWPVAVL
jgi:hypothetical protein